MKKLLYLGLFIGLVAIAIYARTSEQEDCGLEPASACEFFKTHTFTEIKT